MSIERTWIQVNSSRQNIKLKKRLSKKTRKRIFFGRGWFSNTQLNKCYLCNTEWMCRVAMLNNKSGGIREPRNVVFNMGKVYFRSQILERPSIGEYWNNSVVSVLPENVIFMFFRTCWWHPEANNNGPLKWFSVVQHSCTSILDLKCTFFPNVSERVK